MKISPHPKIEPGLTIMSGGAQPSVGVEILSNL
jgi:hypothetical protein